MFGRLWDTIKNVLSLFFSKKSKGFIDIDKDKLNARHEALFRDAIECTIRKSRDKKISITGTWKCKYTNKVFTDPSLLDIDHIVARQYAKNNKVGLWSQQTFVEFENDLQNLITVDRSINRAKGSKSLSEWLPPQNQQWYKNRFQEICEKWGIAIK